MNPWFYLIGAALALLTGFLAADTLAIVAIVALVATCILFIVPRYVLPSLALVVFAVLPVGYVSEVPFSVGRFFTPALVVFLVWIIRGLGSRGPVERTPAWTVTSVVTVSWLIYSTLTSIDPVKSAMWTSSFVVLVLLVGRLAFRVDERTTSSLLRTWLWLGVVLGALGLLEGVIGRSLFGKLYVAADGGFDDRWSVYRITTTLGHPLMNGTFFAVTATLALFVAVQTKSRLAAVSAVFSTAGVAFTVSRSATLALVVGVAAGIILLLTNREQSFGKKIVTTCMVVVGAAGLLYSPLLAERSGSVEGASSTQYRESVIDTALGLSAGDNYLGSGVGTSNIRAIDAGEQFTIENSFLGVLTSAGVPGVMLVSVLLLVAIVTAIKRGRTPVAAAFVAYAVVAAGWPIWENIPGAFVIESALLLLALAPKPAQQTDDVPADFEATERTDWPVRAAKIR